MASFFLPLLLLVIPAALHAQQDIGNENVRAPNKELRLLGKHWVNEK